ncbi:MAG: hydantoinase/oxoprolinase family protein [Clostridia bacterium]|nr:hydantoinase/oxoprolinase family protein [Clostridia bacterium]
MRYIIGIDTGGTYTDAVLCDNQTGRILGRGKSPTTREDLSLGVGRALDMLPKELLGQAGMIALSTTLATNACVENKGGRAKLVLMGTNQKTLEWIGADRKYGLNCADVLCLDTKSSFDGTVVDHPDWERVMEEHDGFLREAEAIAVAEMNAVRNGGACEIRAREALGAKYGVPVVLASELVGGLNMMERGATALLNARLLPVVDQFMKAVKKSMADRGLDCPRMIVRSDGSLMMDELAKQRPVETILSGPAASVMGSSALTRCADCLVVDMGGTTTDVSILRGGASFMSDGIRIGGWRTQVQGVFIDTFGLGGDTRLVLESGRLKLDTRRVEPVCALAAKHPEIKEQLRALLKESRPHTRPLHEFLYLVRRPENAEKYTPGELALMDALADSPKMLGGAALDMYALDSERLEREGVVMRCGLTPTDAMHIRGDYAQFDAEAARLAGRYFLRAMPNYRDDEACLSALCEEIYELAKRRLFENLARVFIEAGYPEIFSGGLDGQMKALIEWKWEHRHEPESRSFFNLKLDAFAALVGIGAPVHLFLPDVAKALGVECVIPESAAVANAVGAAAASVTAQVAVEVHPVYSSEGVDGFSIHAAGVNEMYESYEEALDAAGQAAMRLAEKEAHRRGAMGELSVRAERNERTGMSKTGSQVRLGAEVVGIAIGRIGG